MEDEWTCFICLQVLTEPVTLPCGHEFCLDCLRDAVEKTSCCCPLCRHRLTCFIRTRRQGAGGEWRALINQERWKEIQRNEKLVRAHARRRKRRHSQSTSQSYETEGRSRALVAPGEIRKEYEEAVAKFEEEKHQEYEAGLSLAKQLQTEEFRCRDGGRRRSSNRLLNDYASPTQTKRHQVQQDRELAQKLQEEYDRIHVEMKLSESNEMYNLRKRKHQDETHK